MNFTKPLTLPELAKYLTAEVKFAERSANLQITGVAEITKATKEEATFVANPLYAKQIGTTKAAVVVLEEQYTHLCPSVALVVRNPRLALHKLLQLCAKGKKYPALIHPSATVGKNCQIAASAYIGPNCTLGEDVVIGEGVKLVSNVYVGDKCQVGDNTLIHANTSLYDSTIVGNGCTLQSGCVIGSDGFGFANEQGKWYKLPHLGKVVIGNDVEIGSNSCIDRGCMGDTVIADDVIIDNLVQIAHNVTIGKSTAIAGCVGIAGSATIGKYCLIGGGACIAGHIEIADEVHISATSSVNRSLRKKGVYSSGLPARENKVWLRNVARFNLLDKMFAKLNKEKV